MEKLILLILIPGLAQFIAHLFGYGNPLSFIKEWIALQVFKKYDPEYVYGNTILSGDLEIDVENYQDFSYESEYALWDRIYDRASYHSFFMRLFNCSLCLSSWVVIFICLFMWVNPLLFIAANYLIWKIIQ